MIEMSSCRRQGIIKTMQEVGSVGSEQITTVVDPPSKFQFRS